VTAPEKGCGKTRLLEVLRPVVCRPWFTGHVTTAVLARKIAKDKPTLLLDESDAAFKGSVEYTEKLRGLLNAGFSRAGNYSLVTGKGAEMSCTDLSTFGPKAIAGIGELPDTVASRSIVISMRRKTATEVVERFREREVASVAVALRAGLQSLTTLETIAALRSARPQLPEDLTDRQQDISEPLLAVADLAAGVWSEKARAALRELFGSAVSGDSSIGVQLLQDIRRVFNERGGDRIFSGDLVAALNEMDGQPWPEWSHGNGIRPAQLARLLKKYGITSHGSIRISDQNRKGYMLTSFEEAWSRYCGPDTSKAVTSVTAVTTSVNTGDSQHDDPPQSRSESPVYSHTGAFAAQRAKMMAPSRFSRHRSPGPHAENSRQSSAVTDVTDVTDDSGIVLPSWDEMASAMHSPSTNDAVLSEDDLVRSVFAYFIEQTGRNPAVYTLTDRRMSIGRARLEDCRRKCHGDLTKAEKLMRIAVDSLVASDFHMGKNDRKCQYTDWIDHLFKDTEKLESWLERE
jgi:hypothetical protein